MEYKAEDYIKFIEQRRFDKIGAWGMEIIANKYRRLEQNQGQTLPLDSVSQQRELLKKWWKYFDEESVAVNCNDEEREEVITNFFNCG